MAKGRDLGFEGLTSTTNVPPSPSPFPGLLFLALVRNLVFRSVHSYTQITSYCGLNGYTKIKNPLGD